MNIFLIKMDIFLIKIDIFLIKMNIFLIKIDIFLIKIDIFLIKIDILLIKIDVLLNAEQTETKKARKTSFLLLIFNIPAINTRILTNSPAGTTLY
jgi:hypothetical protein